jgi:hypothetical protein
MIYDNSKSVLKVPCFILLCTQICFGDSTIGNTNFGGCWWALECVKKVSKSQKSSANHHKCIPFEPPRHPKSIQMLLESIPVFPQASEIPILHLLALCDLQVTWFRSQLSWLWHCKHQLWRQLMDLEMCQDVLQTTKVQYFVILCVTMGFWDTSNLSLWQDSVSKHSMTWSP